MSVDFLKRGRFDQSFVVRMIQDFVLILLLVAVAELGLRFALVVSDFYSIEKRATEAAAERLASDIRQIMLNTGGPVAARTVYPILRRSHEDLGLKIAIEPSAVTVQSIKKTFGFTPTGIVPAWPSGTHHAATVEIKAEKFCLSCHSEAAPGDVLGTITVRNYLATHVGHWWEEVQLTGLISLFKILLHATVLFFLLRIRMEPLLSLRAVVSGLAKGGANLSLRAAVKSTDEFGELAADLNHFLDRIGHVLEDLRAVLDKIAALNHRLEAIQERVGSSLDRIDARLDETRDHAQKAQRSDVLLSLEWRESVAALRAALEAVVRDHPQSSALAASFETVLTRLDTTAERVEAILTAQNRVHDGLGALATEFRAFNQFVGEMALLEEKMDRIAESGRILVDRLHVAPG